MFALLDTQYYMLFMLLYKLQVHDKYQYYKPTIETSTIFMLTPPKNKQKAYTHKIPTIYQLALNQAHQSKSPNYRSHRTPQKLNKTANQFMTAAKPKTSASSRKLNTQTTNTENNVKTNKDKINSKQMNVNIKQVQDLNGSRLISQLSKNRQNLVKKIQTYTLINQVQDMNKCLKHDCYLSAYDKNSRMLICISCYNDTNNTKVNKSAANINTITTNESPLKDMQLFTDHKHYKTQTQIQVTNEDTLYKNGCKNCMNLMPIQKSMDCLRKDIQSMRSQIAQEIGTIKKIQDILYLGFDKEQKHLQDSLDLIDAKYQQVIVKLKQWQRQAKQQMMREYRVERNKHEFVLKQLGLLRVVAQEQLKYICKQNNALNKESFEFNKLFTKAGTDTAQNNKINDRMYMSNSRYAEHGQLNSAKDRGVRQTTKQLVFSHLVLKQLTNSIKFSKYGQTWNQQKHINIIQNNSLKHITKIDAILNQINAMI